MSLRALAWHLGAWCSFSGCTDDRVGTGAGGEMEISVLDTLSLRCSFIQYQFFLSTKSFSLAPKFFSILQIKTLL